MRNKLISIAVLAVCCMVSVSMSAGNGGTVVYDRFTTNLLPGVSEREYAVYLPENYETDSAAVYPVLYLLHGGYGSFTDWPKAGNLKATADRMISAGEIQPMIIVCPDGRCRDNTIWFDMDNWPAEQHFFTELIPFIESRYRIKADKSSRAIAGLSLGGGAALGFALAHPDKFAAACGLSAYLRSVSEVVNPRIAWIQPVVNRNNPIEKLKSASESEISQWKTVSWLIDCGDRDFTVQSNADLDAEMNSLRIDHEFLMRSGAHNWRYWNESLPIVLNFIDDVFDKTK